MNHQILKRRFSVIGLSVIVSLLAMSACDRSSRQSVPKISNPEAGEVAEQFENPPPEYSISFYWGWDGSVTEEVIARDLDEYKSHHVYAVSLEPGYEMDSPYLSAGWFERVETAVHLAKERNMRVYLIDEGKYPSGFAGGKISEEAPELRMKALVISERMEVSGGETISVELSPDIISATAYRKADSTNRMLEIENGMLNWSVPEGDWQILPVKSDFQTSPTRSVNNPTRGKDRRHALIDYLDPEATRKFMEFTHESYVEYVGDEFGNTVLGFRGDEPDYSIRGIPWTPEIFNEFERIKGYDVRPWVASFFVPKLSEEQRRIRADYWDVWSSMFAENFFKVQADWCADHHLDYLVHLNHEDNMASMIRSEGDFFKAMRSVQMPGIDAIWHQIWPDDNMPIYPKYASSAAHLFGRRRAFTESFAAYRPQPDINQAKWILDYQLVRGINMVEVMFVPASSRGRSEMRGWLASDSFPEVARYIQRACYLLSRGTPAARLAVYFPTSSIWLGDYEAGQNALEIMQELLDMQRDFDVVDEQSLDSLLILEDGEFVNLSGQGYSTVLIPPVSAISRKALNRLKEFREGGGKVIYLGPEPDMIVDRTFRDATGPADMSWAIHEPTAEITASVLDALPAPDFVLDHPASSIKYAHRSWKDAELYFVFNESDQPQKCNVTLAGRGKVQFWDTMTGQIENISSSAKGKSVEIELALEPWETRFIIVGGKAKF